MHNFGRMHDTVGSVRPARAMRTTGRALLFLIYERVNLLKQYLWGL
jgi:hypothetical protein